MNDLVISIAVILFPGLIATVVCDQIASHSPSWRTFKYVVYSFIFGVVCYIAVQFIDWVGVFFWNGMRWQPPQSFQLLHVWSIATSQRADIKLGEVLAASAISPFVAALATAIDTLKLLTRAAQWLHVSWKFGDENLFSYYLNRKDIEWVYIRDPSVNQTYEGSVELYSETDHIQEIVLSDVTVYNYETIDRLYWLPSIYLARPIGTFTIEAGIPKSLKQEDT